LGSCPAPKIRVHAVTILILQLVAESCFLAAQTFLPDILFEIFLTLNMEAALMTRAE
jgi:hypothetical protein